MNILTISKSKVCIAILKKYLHVLSKKKNDEINFALPRNPKISIECNFPEKV